MTSLEIPTVDSKTANRQSDPAIKASSGYSFRDHLKAFDPEEYERRFGCPDVLCPRHGDPRDTNVANPEAETCSAHPDAARVDSMLARWTLDGIEGVDA